MSTRHIEEIKFGKLLLFISIVLSLLYFGKIYEMVRQGTLLGHYWFTLVFFGSVCYLVIGLEHNQAGNLCNHWQACHYIIKPWHVMRGKWVFD